MYSAVQYIGSPSAWAAAVEISMGKRFDHGLRAALLLGLASGVLAGCAAKEAPAQAPHSPGPSASSWSSS